MNFSDGVLRSGEKAIYTLRALYRKYGYSQYKVGKFEEYDLYARNKSFLVSENILTFTDTDGKLMALKPDVTLSIVKNVPSDFVGTYKLCYNENVYRTSAESHGFREIMQTGLECIGDVDRFSEGEVVMLAQRSLGSISDEYVLDISHMGLIEGLLDGAGLDGEARAEALKLVKSRNTSAIGKFADGVGMTDEARDALCGLTQIYMPLENALEVIGNLTVGEKMRTAYGELCEISELMKNYGLSEKLYFDFSVVNDCNYYDGIIFKGFINGIPDSVLTGGRYDRLIKKMGKSCGAIGFAVYLDRLERFGTESGDYDADILLLYGDGTDAKTVSDTVKFFVESGKTVRTARTLGGDVKYRQLLKIGKGGIEILETND